MQGDVIVPVSIRTTIAFVAAAIILFVGFVQAQQPLDPVMMMQLSAVLLGGSAVVLLLLRALRIRQEVSKSIAVLATACAVSATISFLQAPSKLDALPRSAAYLALVFVGYTAYRTFRGTSWRVSSWFCLVVTCITPMIAVSFVDLVRWPVELQSQHVGTFTNVRHLGTAAFISACAASGLAIDGNRNRWIASSCSFFAVFVVVATGSRGAFLAWMLFVGLVAIFGHRNVRRTVAIHGVVVAVGTSAVVGVLHVTGVWASNNIFVRVSEQATGQAEITSGRLGLWAESLDLFTDEPWFGRGPDAYRILSGSDATVAHPHDLVLQLLLEFGAVGCGLLVLLTILSLRILLRSAHRSWWAAIQTGRNAPLLAAMVIAHLALSMVDGPCYWLLPMLLLAISLGLLAATLGDLQSSPIENADSRSWRE